MEIDNYRSQQREKIEAIAQKPIIAVATSIIIDIIE